MKPATVAIVGLLAARTTTASPEVVSSRKLNEHSAAYDGAEVSVQGMLVLGTNGRSIYQSEERFKQWVGDSKSDEVDYAAYTADCLTLVGPGAVALIENTELLHMRTVTLRGTFAGDYNSPNAVDLQKCANQSALVVDMASARTVIRRAGGSVK